MRRLFMATSGTVVLSIALSAATAEQELTYSFERGPLGRIFDGHPKRAAVEILEKLNRADSKHLRTLKTIVVPSRFDLDELAYSPLPQLHPPAITHPKLLLVHLPTQVFGGYERGKLIRWGPISSGARQGQTPAGLFHLNWRAESCCSTINPSWRMTWYFNFENFLGLALHAYTLPGRPASHGCIRMLARDAKWLFQWGEQWSLSQNGQQVIRHGTPVVVLGAYEFERPFPWLDPEFYKKALALPYCLP